SCRLWPADRHHPLAAFRRMVVGPGKSRPQFLGRLFESKAPIVEHVFVLRRAYATRDPVECRVLVRMQAHHVAYRQGDATDEHHEESAERRLAIGADVLDDPGGGEPTEYRERGHHKNEMT